MSPREILSMERPLVAALPELGSFVARAPSGALRLFDLRVGSWLDAQAGSVHQLLRHAYRRGGGSVVAELATWHRDFTGDCDFDPDACFLAWNPSGELVGVALC